MGAPPCVPKPAVAGHLVEVSGEGAGAVLSAACALVLDAQRRGEVGSECQPQAVAQFVVASLEGAMLLSKVTKEIGVMEQCVSELKRYLGTFEVGA